MRLGHTSEKNLQALEKEELLKGAKTCKLEFLNTASLARRPK